MSHVPNLHVLLREVIASTETQAVQALIAAEAGVDAAHAELGIASYSE